MATIIIRARTAHEGGLHAEITISRDLLREALAEGAGELLVVDREDAEMRLWLNQRELIITKATVTATDR
jgi:hypothetical protein